MADKGSRANKSGRPGSRRLDRRGTSLKVVTPGDDRAPRPIVVPKARRAAGKGGASKAAQPPDRPAATGRKRRVFLGSRYKIHREIGSGGTGIVYKAQDLLLDMPVAVKVLHPALARDRGAVAALKQEARIAIQLAHRHIVRLYDLQQIGGTYFLIMEYVEGRSFRGILQEFGHLDTELVVQTIRVCAEALAYAHRHDVLHNDLKPGNLLLSRDGVLKIIDFGVASLVGRSPSAEWMVGTPAYMSPEQKAGNDLDVRTDVYALGMIAYEFLTGRVPFPPATSAEQLMTMKPGRLEGVSTSLREVLERALADRQDRWESVEALAEALSRAAGSEHANEAP